MNPLLHVANMNFRSMEYGAYHGLIINFIATHERVEVNVNMVQLAVEVGHHGFWELDRIHTITKNHAILLKPGNIK